MFLLPLPPLHCLPYTWPFTQDSLEDLSNIPERISEGFRQSWQIL